MVDQPAQTTVFRAALRREKVAARLALPEETHALASARTLAHLSKMLKTRPPGVIAFCWPVRAEVDCRPLILDLISASWQAAMPTVTTPAAPMQFRAWTPDTPMTTDPFGIPVPQTTHCVTPNVVLLPLVAADLAGYRLGYGGGYFDRTLAVSVPRPLTIGVGFELAIVSDIHPEPHDIPLDVIVTESGVRLLLQPDTSGLSITSV